jgi:DNA-directed RNA polymerase I, II, and III subunit RPABC2
MSKQNITLELDEKDEGVVNNDEIDMSENEDEINVGDSDVESDIEGNDEDIEGNDEDVEETVEDDDDEDEVDLEDEQLKRFENEMLGDMYDEEDDDSDLEEDYLQKIDSSMQTDIVSSHHPELLQHKTEEIETLSKVVRNEENMIVDPFHKTVPFLTKYEKARILGERAKQLNAGGKPFVNVDPSILDGYLIAEKELNEKKLPFIIKRPITNGACEYWKVEDLEILY